MIHYPAYQVAAAHVAPVFLDTDRSVEQVHISSYPPV